MDGIRERLASLERREVFGLLAIGGLLALVAVLWYLRSVPAPVAIAKESGPRPATSALVVAPTETAPAPSGPPGQVVVDVAGRVREPGVYTLNVGDRVIDAIRRAGGALPGADLTSLNLAALLSDGEQIVVGRAGDVGHASGTTAGGGSSTTGGGAGGGSGGLVNVNTATLDELEALPGIGPVLAQRIIDYREQHGPFGSVQDLLNVSGIGDSHLSDLEPLVTV
jgi:competence protein ComEA